MALKTARLVRIIAPRVNVEELFPPNTHWLLG